MIWAVLGLALGATAAAAMLWRRIRQRGLDRWLVPYVLQTPKRRLPAGGQDVHLILCFADHFEPKSDRATPERAKRRLEHWVREYPRQFASFRDSDGRYPRHTFFYPIEEYEAAHVDVISGLCRAGFGEVEMHLHHDNDNASQLRRQLLDFKNLLAIRHGLLARNAQTGELAYGFIHGNWALCNSRPDHRLCGVNEELDVLRETGCYADFTMPSAPHPTQTRKINSLYYAVNRPGVARSHDDGVDVGAGPPPAGGTLLIQGPLVFDWRQRKLGVVPRLENGCVQNSQPASLGRVASWLRARVQVPSRPDWFFVKLHSHGAEESSHQALLGEPMVKFHRDLAEEARRSPRFHFHYVTARELYNLVKAAEAGWSGHIADALDYELIWNGGVGSSYHAPGDDSALAITGSKTSLGA
jgi:hypothetical protein